MTLGGAFPTQRSVRDALVELHSQFGVFDGCSQAELRNMAEEAADTWRIILRRLYDLKKAEKAGKEANRSISHLLRLIELPGSPKLEHSSTETSLTESIELSDMGPEPLFEGQLDLEATAALFQNLEEKGKDEDRTATATWCPRTMMRWSQRRLASAARAP